MIDIIILFEDILKKYKVLYFDKIYEKTKDKNWKLIYNIQGLTTDDNSMFYPNLKFIFWLDKTKTKLTDNVISYLYTQNCDYKSITIKEDLQETIDVILKFIKKEKTNVELSTFILNGTEEFNKILKNNNIEDFLSNLTFIPHGNKTCIDTKFEFKIESNTETYYFQLKSLNGMWELYMEDIQMKLNIEDVYKKIIEIIYAIK